MIVGTVITQTESRWPAIHKCNQCKPVGIQNIGPPAYSRNWNQLIIGQLMMQSHTYTFGNEWGIGLLSLNNTNHTTKVKKRPALMSAGLCINVNAY